MQSNYVKSSVIFLILSPKLAISPINPSFYVLYYDRWRITFLILLTIIMIKQQWWLIYKIYFFNFFNHYSRKNKSFVVSLLTTDETSFVFNVLVISKSIRMKGVSSSLVYCHVCDERLEERPVKRLQSCGDFVVSPTIFSATHGSSTGTCCTIKHSKPCYFTNLH